MSAIGKAPYANPARRRIGAIRSVILLGTKSLDGYVARLNGAVDNGAGLGTVIGEKGARNLAKDAGFRQFERLPIQNPFNQFFALRK